MACIPSWPPKRCFKTCTLRFTFCAIMLHGFDKLMVTCSHHYSSIQKSFTILKFSVLLLINSTSPQNHWQPLATTDLSAVSIASPCPECYTSGIIHYVVFSEWLLLLSNMHVRFIFVFAWIDSSFLFIAEYYSTVWMYSS